MKLNLEKDVGLCGIVVEEEMLLALESNIFIARKKRLNYFKIIILNYSYQ